MNIGIDIDNVISNFDEVLKKEFLIHDKELRNTGIINPEAPMTKGMFDWTDDEIYTFYLENIGRITPSLDVIEGAKEYKKKKKNDGHTIVIITGRDKRIFKNPKEVTKEWLEKNNIYYDELVFKKTPNKIEECKNYKVDIMLDDLAINVKKLRENNVNAYLVRTRYNENYSLNMPMLLNWEDIYNFIKKMKSEEK